MHALVAADRSASTSSSFSRDYVEQWRATVEVSADELSSESDVLLDSTTEAALQASQTVPHRAGNKGSSPSSPGPKRSRPEAGLGEGAKVQHSQESGTGRAGSSGRLKQARPEHRGVQPGSRVNATRPGSQREASEALAVRKSSRRGQQLGRDRTNDNARAHTWSDSECVLQLPSRLLPTTLNCQD